MLLCTEKALLLFNEIRWKRAEDSRTKMFPLLPPPAPPPINLVLFMLSQLAKSWLQTPQFPSCLMLCGLM